MNLAEAIAATGMTPPRAFPEGKWLRFPGIGKGRSNRSGWCRVISPTMAIFGDWASGFRQVWHDDSHTDDKASQQALRDAQARERRFAAEQSRKQSSVANDAHHLVSDSDHSTHPYLARKGFPDLIGLTSAGNLVVPVLDFERYPNILTVQLINEDGQKKFLPGGRAKGGVYRLGVPAARARRVLLCEGYATGLSLDAAVHLLPGSYCVIVCFSARNLELIASIIPESMDCLVCADNDASRTGEESARRTGRKWIMPIDVGTDWNDVHVSQGLHAVMEAVRDA